MTIQRRDQLALDEQVIRDDELEAALELRQSSREKLAEMRKRFDLAHETASAEVAKLELPEGRAVRVGRFRITRTGIPARSVSFETKASSRVRISLVGDE